MRKNMKQGHHDYFLLTSRLLSVWVFFVTSLLLLSGLFIGFIFSNPSLPIEPATKGGADQHAQGKAPVPNQESPMPADQEERALIQYGKELVSRTSVLLGPASPKAYSGNALNCQSCHLEAGTKDGAISLVPVTRAYPSYRARENKVIDLEDRVNNCFERSMNGKALPKESEEMRAIVAYIAWLGKNDPQKKSMRGLSPILLPARAANTSHGGLLYQQKCGSCHGKDGQGVKSPEGMTLYPPLWGAESYNNGAGMHRLLTAAAFIKANMPLGARLNKTYLTDEEAYDIAAFINSFDRPVSVGRKNDYPDLRKKPVDAPYPPFADSFSLQQHQIGPFQPIQDYYTKH
jgi:thiosulfate dehydrogenase